jgi:hypothetical protein
MPEEILRMNREELIVYVGILLGTSGQTAALLEDMRHNLEVKTRQAQLLSEELSASRQANIALLGDLERAYLVIQRLKGFH